jgi:hypothetical protein
MSTRDTLAKLALGHTTVLEQTRDRALTVAAFVETSLRHHVVVARKPGTTEKYDAILRKHWLPALGRLPMTAVTRDHIKAVLMEKLGAGLKPSTVRGHLDVLRPCLSPNSDVQVAIRKIVDSGIRPECANCGDARPFAAGHPEP